ncbi:MAG: GUN4 domain-containing protein [Bacteroidota bacterium]
MRHKDNKSLRATITKYTLLALFVSSITLYFEEIAGDQSFIGKQLEVLLPNVGNIFPNVSNFISNANTKSAHENGIDFKLAGIAISVGYALWIFLRKILVRFLDSFTNTVGTKVEESGDNLATSLSNYILRHIKRAGWQFSHIEEKYLRCQIDSCKDYKTESLSFLDIPTSIKMPFEDIFTPLQVSRHREKARSQSMISSPEVTSKEDSISWGDPDSDIWEYLEEGGRYSELRSVAILAAVGYGKTSLLKHITLAYAQSRYPRKSRRVKHRIPFFISLRQFQDFFNVDENTSLPTLISRFHIRNLKGGSSIHVPEDWIKAQLSSGRAIVLLDGFDEIKKSKRQEASYWVNQQIRDYPESIFLIASRYEGFKDDYKAEQLDLVLYIKQLDKSHQRLFLDKWYFQQVLADSSRKRKRRDIRKLTQERVDHLLSQINTSEQLGAMTGNPLLLTMIATLHKSSPETDLPRERAILYKRILELQLEDRQQFKHHYYGKRGPHVGKYKTNTSHMLSKYQSRRLLQILALALTVENSSTSKKQSSNNQSSFIRNNQFYLHPALTKIIKERLFEIGLEDIDSVDSIITELVESSQILRESKSPLTEDEYKTYEFSHLSFQEFLTAAEIKRTKRETLLLSHSEEDDWREIFLFYSALQNDDEIFSRFIIEICQKATRNSIWLAWQCLNECPLCLGDESKLTLHARQKLVGISRQLKFYNTKVLEKYLRIGDWLNADRETYLILVECTCKSEGEILESADYKSIPLEVLRQVDWLWQHYSKGRFGFTPQKRTFMKIVGKQDVTRKAINTFASELNWRSSDGKWHKYRNINFDFSISEITSFPKGYLPIAVSNFRRRDPFCSISWNSVFDRIEALEI